MRRRAELVDRTRLRITEAAVRLHTTIGPANTTISTLAEEAGVTRLTVYRHFPDLGELFAACRSHWIDRHPPPDRAGWLGTPGLEDRAQVALRELYPWYRANADDLFPIARDTLAMPPAARAIEAREAAALADALLDGARDRAGRPPGRLVRAAAGHVTSYWTWRSLALEQGLTDAEAAELAVALLRAAAADTDGGPTG